jgi:hypothetical protein
MASLMTTHHEKHHAPHNPTRSSSQTSSTVSSSSLDLQTSNNNNNHPDTQDDVFGPDLEKGPSQLSDSVPEAAAVTAAVATSIHRTVTADRISRVQSLTNRFARDNTFTHPLSHQRTTAEYIVDFDGPDDPYRPANWPFRKKCITTLLYGMTTMGATFMSTVYSPVTDIIAEDYGVSREVSLLGVTFTLLGKEYFFFWRVFFSSIFFPPFLSSLFIAENIPNTDSIFLTKNHRLRTRTNGFWPSF